MAVHTTDPPFLSRLSVAYIRRALLTHVPTKASRDVLNRLRFGAGAPRSDEPIFVDPALVARTYRPDFQAGRPKFRRHHSGLVLAGDWDLGLVPVTQSAKLRAVTRHFAEGVPWEDSGIYELAEAAIARDGHFDGCRTLADLRDRYARIDGLFEQIRREGRLRLRMELPVGFRREYGGIYAHVTRQGEVVQAGGGIHRLTLAKLAGLREVPLQLGVVHRRAWEDGHLARLRRSIHDAETLAQGDGGS